MRIWLILEKGDVEVQYAGGRNVPSSIMYSTATKEVFIFESYMMKTKDGSNGNPDDSSSCKGDLLQDNPQGQQHSKYKHK